MRENDASIADAVVARRLVRLLDELENVTAHRDRVLAALSAAFDALEKVRQGGKLEAAEIEQLPGFGEWKEARRS